MPHICYNGNFVDAQHPVLLADNRSYRYGDGFFETIRIFRGNIVLEAYHRTRIETTLKLLQYKLSPLTTIDTIFKNILELCRYNHCEDSARVRLSFSNGNGAIFDTHQHLDYIIEAWPLNTSNALNKEGLKVGIFTDMKKSCDTYAQLKTASALIYSVAARTATINSWDDSLILNQHDRICESSIANIFWIKDKKIYTTPLTEGCINGVMRTHLMQSVSITESICTQEQLKQADEVFLTNAIKGMVWVQSIESITQYSNFIIQELYCDCIQPLFA
ncbi:Branched-chain-amino-acid aminotransferase [Mycovorax composti]|uniref:branched-chain-amino-acid transaminase n=1 Tax=Mycovorax composti TaxID=2962693 RepID=A0ABZ2EMJ0_9BACT